MNHPSPTDAIVTVRNVKKSSFVQRIAYCQSTQELTLEFLSGTYTYSDVPAMTAKTLWEAKSYGKAYNRLIKGQFKSEKVAL